MHILVTRFSAMGDVAMVVPVLKLLLHQHPTLKVTIVSQPFLQPLFQDLERCNFVAFDKKEAHKNVFGLFQLFQHIKKQYPDINAVADLHDVLRTKIFRKFFSLSGRKIAVIDKGRAEKKALTRREGKALHQLKTTHQRYADVFEKLGCKVELKLEGSILKKKELPTPTLKDLFANGKKNIGIAPFAQHKEKMYPLEKMEQVVKQLSESNRFNIYFFGGGKAEIDLLNNWQTHFANAYTVAGNHKLADELQIISNLDKMLSMDSANMHLASLFGVPVVSIWGATHPYAGFYGWGQAPANIVQENLFCRPCSVFGNKPCYRNNLECMKTIHINGIIDRIQKA